MTGTEPKLTFQDLEEFVENPCYAYILERLQEIKQFDTAISEDANSTNEMLRSAIAHRKGICQLEDIIKDLEARLEIEEQHGGVAHSRQPIATGPAADLALQIRAAHKQAGGKGYARDARSNIHDAA